MVKRSKKGLKKGTTKLKKGTVKIIKGSKNGSKKGSKNGSKKGSKRGSYKCPSGKILRNSYIRKSYKKSSGTKVSKSIVGSKCIIDRGKPGKGPKTLPLIKEKNLLRKYGYSTKLSHVERQKILKNAVKKEGELLILKHLNLIRNYQSTKLVKDKMTRDVNFLSKLYSNK